MRKFLSFTIIFILKNSYALGYECNKEFTITNFDQKTKILNKTVNSEHGQIDSYNYFIFDNSDMMVVKQQNCLMVDYYISYYYNDVKNFNAMYDNYLSIVSSIFKNEKININQEFKNKLKNAIDEEEIKEKKYFNGYYRSYPLTIDRSGISFEYNFKLINSIRSSAYKNIFSTYIGLGGMP